MDAADSPALLTPADTAGWPEHVLDHRQTDLVVLLLGDALGRSGFADDLPLEVPADLPVAAGQWLALRDAEGVTVAGVQVESGPPRLTGRLTAASGLTDADALDLRHTPTQVRAWADSRPVRAAWLHDAPDDAQVAALAAAARDGALLLLAPLGAHDVGDRAWYARAATVRATAELLRADAPGRVLAVAVPDPGRDDLRAAVVAAHGATALPLPPRDGEPVPALAAAVARFAPPPSARGVVVLLTGLSGSGKSTVARALAARLMELGPRAVTLLDGDVVRRSLSSELGFSREHRDLNVRRIGWVAAEVGRHGGVAIACPIAPYAASRDAVRAMAQEAGATYVLVHVATPLEVCEARDRKGLYALARAGRIPEFTGISDPYEAPTDADLVLDTSTVPVEGAVEQVLAVLRGRQVIAPQG